MNVGEHVTSSLWLLCYDSYAVHRCHDVTEQEPFCAAGEAQQRLGDPQHGAQSRWQLGIATTLLAPPS
jgi:hypothetical protein